MPADINAENGRGPASGNVGHSGHHAHPSHPGHGGHMGQTNLRAATNHPYGEAGVAAMMNQLSGMGLGGGPSMAHHSPTVGGHPAYMLPPEYVLASMPGAHGIPFEGYGAGTTPYVGHGQYANYCVPMLPYTPGRAMPMAGRHERHSDVPGLENRRGSYSTNESTPATPFYVTQRDQKPRIATLDRSNYTTPSPQGLTMGAVLQTIDSNKTNVVSAAADASLDDMIKKEPVVPKAVPAVFTPAGQMKSLEQSLENRIPGNRNVYIRGLHPTTDDVLLHAFASRFGAVETSKAIIDTSTGACKG